MELIFQMPTNSAIIFSLKWNVQIFIERCCRYSGKYFLCCTPQITRRKDSKTPDFVSLSSIHCKTCNSSSNFHSTGLLSFLFICILLFISVSLTCLLKVELLLSFSCLFCCCWLCMLFFFFVKWQGFFYLFFLSNILLECLIPFSSIMSLKIGVPSTK